MAKKNSDHYDYSSFKVIAAVAAAAGAAIWGVSSLFSSSSNDKMMKAPGRPGQRIRRDIFEQNPKDYFRDLHGNSDHDDNSGTFKTIVVLAAAGAAIWGVSSLFSSSSNDKMMRAPGRPDQRIRRAVFEKSPKDYFRDLRRKYLSDN